MNRRDFLRVTGLAAGAVAFGGAAVLAEAPPAALETTLVIGDVFTIAGLYAVNPITQKSTGYLRQFVVTSISDSEIGMHPYQAGFSTIAKTLAGIQPLGN